MATFLSLADAKHKMYEIAKSYKTGLPRKRSAGAPERISHPLPPKFGLKWFGLRGIPRRHSTGWSGWCDAADHAATTPHTRSVNRPGFAGGSNS
jgi:hypothetical protein